MNLKNIHNIYFIGIGGIGMSALARYFLSQDYQISGYDKVSSVITEALEKLGALIHFTEDLKSIPEPFFDPLNTLIIYTPAISAEHKELVYFQ